MEASKCKFGAKIYEKLESRPEIHGVNSMPFVLKIVIYY